MQAVGGISLMNSVQHPFGAKTLVFRSTSIAIGGPANHVNLDFVRPCRSAQFEGSLVSGRPPSSVSVPVPEIRADKSSIENGLVDDGLSEADPEVGAIIGKRYYGGNEYIDELEILCQKRALAAFNLDSKKWGVNVQPLLGSPANFEVYTAILSPHDRIMGLNLPHGRHLSHGFMTAKRRESGTSIYLSMPLTYPPYEYTGNVDYDVLEETAILFDPKLIIASASAYPRDLDYTRIRKMADAVGALLIMDMSPISGLVSAAVVASPFEYCDIVTTTTDKFLRGPRGGMIFFRKGPVLGVDLESAINNAIFPGMKGGSHNDTIVGLAVSLQHAQSPEFKAYQKKLVSNSRALARRLMELGYRLVSGGSDNHLVLVDVRRLCIDGARLEKILKMASITVNKSSVPGDKSARVPPGGIRIDSNAMTTRGFGESEFIRLAEFIHEGVVITMQAKKAVSSPKLTDFMKFVSSRKFRLTSGIVDLQRRVEMLATQFPIPGLECRVLVQCKDTEEEGNP